MTLNQQPSSEPEWVTIADGSDRDWRSISMYELKKLEHAINENEPGHIKEMHDSGNEVIDKIRSRSYNQQSNCPGCGGGLMCHRWCIDRDCGWDSVKELRQSEIHTKDIGNVKKEDTIFTPVRHVDGE
jgi:hypothetical protein